MWSKKSLIAVFLLYYSGIYWQWKRLLSVIVGCSYYIDIFWKLPGPVIAQSNKSIVLTGSQVFSFLWKFCWWWLLWHCSPKSLKELIKQGNKIQLYKILYVCKVCSWLHIRHGCRGLLIHYRVWNWSYNYEKSLQSRHFYISHCY